MKAIFGIISIAIGYALGHYFLEGALAVYASILISYHLYLVILIATASHEKGLSLSISMTALTHFAIVTLLLLFSYERTHILFFGLIRWFIPALAPFETKWLFSGKGQFRWHVSNDSHNMAEATLEEHEAFREYLGQGQRAFRKPGRTMDDEFNFWLADRNKNKAKAEALAAATTADESANSHAVLYK
jgi:hypothetical protein